MFGLQDKTVEQLKEAKFLQERLAEIESDYPGRLSIDLDLKRCELRAVRSKYILKPEKWYFDEIKKYEERIKMLKEIIEDKL